MARRLLTLSGLFLILSATNTAQGKIDGNTAGNYLKAKRIVYSIFPRSTRSAALRVVKCETGQTYSEWSHNNGSDARGYFQILYANSGRVLYFRGHSFRIVGENLYDPWYNTLVAYYISKGGSTWSEWSCKP